LSSFALAEVPVGYDCFLVRDVKFVFSKFKFQLLKFGLNSNFVYIFVEKLKQFAFDVCNVGRDEGRSMHARKQSINSAISQDVKPCRALLLWIDVCSVSGPPRFDTLIACISIQHAPGAGRREISKHAAGVAWIDGWQRTKKSSHSAPLSRQNRLRLISDAWIWISKGWKTNTNSKFANPNFV